MKPIKFPGANAAYGAGQKEYQTLYAWKNESKEGEVVACWKMNFRERVKALLTGKIWVQLLSFNKPLTPSYVTVDSSDLIQVKTEKISREGIIKLRWDRFKFWAILVFLIGILSLMVAMLFIW